ncbi:MAG: phage antirepressor N-terminal domain-containing protein [Desulfobacterales bacterium]|nr:phage antirepressor N-terminal domain-containing protein [Desulfobacterales bacterium]
MTSARQPLPNPSIVNEILKGEPLSLLREEEMDWVALKPLCEGLGLNWAGERSRLKNDAKFTCRFFRMKGSDGKGRDFLCLPFYQLSGWLFSLHSGRVRKEMKRALELFQAESLEALFSHWGEGQVEAELPEEAPFSFEGHAFPAVESNVEGPLVKREDVEKMVRDSGLFESSPSKEEVGSSFTISGSPEALESRVKSVIENVLGKLTEKQG